MKAQIDLVKRKNLDFAHHPLSRDEEETIDGILETDANCDVTVTPGHHIDAQGLLRGFRVAYPRHTSEVVLPVSREMFFGHTIVEAGSSVGPNADFMRLASDPARCRQLMTELLTEIDTASIGHEAGLHCIPQNVQVWDASKVGGVGRGAFSVEGRATDSAPWEPEIPVRLGVYHAFVRGLTKDSREHKVFLGVTGGCTLAAEGYYNLLLDLGTDTDLEEVVDCEETFWLRQASYRARCRILALAAQKFELSVKTMTDINAYGGCQMALATTDTIYNNITRLRSGHVAVFSDCVDTTTSKNGIVNAMHPSEGLWVYKGSVRSSAGGSHMGLGFGDQRRCGIFPSGTFPISTPPRGGQDPWRDYTTVFSRNANCVVPYKCDEHATPKRFTWPDEKYFGVLRDMGWDRNNGIVELMPIVVGITRW